MVARAVLVPRPPPTREEMQIRCIQVEDEIHRLMGKKLAAEEEGDVDRAVRYRKALDRLQREHSRVWRQYDDFEIEDAKRTGRPYKSMYADLEAFCIPAQEHMN